MEKIYKKGKLTKELIEKVFSDVFDDRVGERSVVLHVSFPTEEAGKIWFEELGFCPPENILTNHYYSFPEDFKTLKFKEYGKQ